MKLIDIVGQRSTLEKIAGKEMEGGVALEFANFAKSVLVEIQNFEAKRAELFQKYGEEIGEGKEKHLQIKSENEKKFNMAIKRAINKELNIEPYPIAALGIAITPTELFNATGLFK